MAADLDRPRRPEQPDQRQGRVHLHVHRLEPVDGLDAGRDPVSERVGERVADQLAGDRRSLRRVAVCVRAVPGSFGRGRGQRVAHVQGQTELQHGQKQERQQDADEGELDDSGPSVFRLLVGWSHERAAIRVFRLSRIRAKVAYSTKAEHDFQRPAGFDPREYANRIPWQLGDPLGTAEIWVSDHIAWQVERSFGAPPLAEPWNPHVRETQLERPARLVRAGA